MAWVPLESNPEVLNKYLTLLGVTGDWQLSDVLGLDPVVLDIVPKPCLALILLFPDESDMKKEDPKMCSPQQNISSRLFYLKQTIYNACGAIALIHCVANNLDTLNVAEGPFKQYLEAAQSVGPEERGPLMSMLSQVHEKVAKDGQSVAPAAEDRVDHHYVALVHCDGGLYELDGCKPGPIRHGDTTPTNFLKDAALVCQQYMDRDPGNVAFSIMALAPPDPL